MTTYKHLALLFRDRAFSYQSRVAVKYKEPSGSEWISMSWAQWIENVNQLSRSLIAEHVMPFDKVGIFSRNMPEWTITDIALMSIRGISVPFYSTDSASQVAYIIEETGLRLVFVGEQEQFDVLLEVSKKITHPIKIVVFDSRVNLQGYEQATYYSEFIKKTSNQEDEELQLRLASLSIEDIVTIIYTSGTTGEPKGVVLKQKNFINTLKIHDVFLHLSENDVSLAFLPFSHIFERTWTLMAMHRGITNYYLLNPKEIAQALKEVKPTIFCVVPRFFEKTYNAVFEQVASYSFLKKSIFYWSVRIGEKIMENKRSGQISSFYEKIQYRIADALVLKKGRAVLGGNIRFIPCGGAALSDEINRFFQSVGVHIKYAYGLTETIATVSVFDDFGFKFGTVGKPLAGIQLRIGENNEIQIKGDSVFTEYYKKPLETQQAFDDGWFKTGDAGSIDEDGFLIMTERIKDLIKTSSGKFVAPQMIEMKLMADPFIEQAIVIGDNRKHCVALIVPAFSLLEAHAKKEQIHFNSIKELLEKRIILQLFEERIDTVLKDIAEYQKIKRFCLLPSDFSIQTGELTPTLKTKRKFIAEKYKEEIEKLYVN